MPGSITDSTERDFNLLWHLRELDEKIGIGKKSQPQKKSSHENIFKNVDEPKITITIKIE